MLDIGNCECCGVKLYGIGFSHTGRLINLRTDICDSCLEYKTKAERYKKQKEMYGEVK